MKNSIKGILVILFSLFLFPIMVYADMGAPEVTSYDVRIKNTDGATLYDFYNKEVGTIPYDTKVTVMYEYEDKGKLYGTIEYNGKSYEINLADVEVFTEKVDLSKFHKAKTPVKLYVFDDDCYMFKGPSKIYGKVDGNVKIPVGETIEYEYSDEIWAYVEYNGVKGWIINCPQMQVYSDIKNSVATVTTEDSKIYIINDIKSIFKSINSQEKVNVSIPAGEELSYDYYVQVGKATSVHVNYKGTEGWITTYYSSYGDDTESGTLSYKCGLLFIGEENGIYVYKNARDINSKTNKKFEHGKILELKYSFTYDKYNWYKVSEDGKDYWLASKFDYEDGTDNLEFRGWASVIKTKGKAVMYEEDNTESKVLKDNIKAGTTLTAIFFEYTSNNTLMVYAEYDGEYGWIYVDNYTYEDAVSICANQPVEPNIVEENENEKDKDKEKDEKKSMSIKQIVLLAIGGAVVLALVMVVIIKIVNKRKVNNN